MIATRVASLRSPAVLTSYNITENGFLPSDPPLDRLRHESYLPWESLIDGLRYHLEDGERFRAIVDAMEILPTTHLKSEAEWRRAYSLLCMLAQGYIWGGRLPSERLPPPLSVPLLQVSTHLQMLPVATYAALNLWNYRRISPGKSLIRPEDVSAMHTLTGTEDESWFYVISVAMEARAGPIITTMLMAMEDAEQGNEETVIAALEYFGSELNDIGNLLERMDERCRPDVFYHRIRPRLAGTRNMEAVGLPNGVFFDEGEGRGSWRRYRGGSNGQSSLIQFFDIVLGVQHGNPSFHKGGPHARFLDHLEEVANLRGFVHSRLDRPKLIRAYNAAVDSLVAFRDKHIQLVTRYILLPSRKSVKHADVDQRRDLAMMNSQAALKRSEGFVGTGGTKLVPFLKHTRDETVVAAVNPSDLQSINTAEKRPDAQTHPLRHR